MNRTFKALIAVFALLFIFSTVINAQPPWGYSLEIDSTSGGEVTEPGEGTFNYEEGEEVRLLAEPDPNYEFSIWRGDIGSIDDIYSRDTYIEMNGDYEITANFESDLDPAYFQVKIDDTNSPVGEGGTLEVEAIVRNTGDYSDSQSIRLYIDGDQKDSEEVTLGGGESESITLEWVTQDEDKGEYTAEVSSNDDSDTEPIEIKEAHFDEPYFDVRIDAPQEDEEFPDHEDITLVYTVENIGGETGEQTISFLIEDQEETTSTHELDPGEIEEDSFVWNPGEYTEGEHELKIESEDEEDSVDITINLEAFFEVTITDPEDEEVLERGNNPVGVEIENMGGKEDTQTIELLINNEQEATKTETLDPYSKTSSSVFFTWDAEEDHSNLKVRSEDHYSWITIKVPDLEDPYFQVDIMEPEDGSVFAPGQKLDIEYTVENIGEEEDHQRITFYVDEEKREESDLISLDKNQMHRASFSWTTQEPLGERELSVESNDENKKILIEIEEEEEEGHQLEIKTEGKGGTKPEEGTYEYENGTNVRVEAVEEVEDWYFEGWTEDCTGTDPECELTMDRDKEVTAHFTEEKERPKFETKIISPAEQDTITEGEELTIKYAVRNTGDAVGTQSIELKSDQYLIHSEEYTLEPDQTRTSNLTVTLEKGERQLTLESKDHEYILDLTVEEEPETYELTIKVKGDGKTNPPEGTHSYTEGEHVTITTEPDDGWVFEEWTGDVEAYNQTEITVVMDQNHEVTAQFTGLESGRILRAAAITTTVAIIIIMVIFLFLVICKRMKRTKKAEEEKLKKPKTKLPKKLREKIEGRGKTPTEQKKETEEQETEKDAEPVEKEETQKEIGKEPEKTEEEKEQSYEEMERKIEEKEKKEEGETLATYKIEENDQFKEKKEKEEKEE